jgi:hypothetical protein
MPDDAALATEARTFARYLVGRVPPDEIVARYVDASRTLFPAPAASEETVVGFARRHPWSVGFLDAAGGLLHPGSLLRSKILVMAAILEASPTFADDFLPRAVHPVGLVLQLAVHGSLAVVRALLGPLVWAAASRSRA